MTAPATPTPLTETPLAWIEDALPYRDPARCTDPECLAGGECAGCQNVREIQDAFGAARALVEAALARDASTLATLRDAELALIEACAAYRAWTPAPATVTSGDSGGSGGGGEGE